MNIVSMHTDSRGYQNDKKEKGFGGYGTYVVTTAEVSQEHFFDAVKEAEKAAQYLSNKYPDLNVLLLSETTSPAGGSGTHIHLHVGMFGSMGAWEKWWRGSVLADTEFRAIMEEWQKIENEKGVRLFQNWTQKFYTIYFSREQGEVKKNIKDWEKRYKVVAGVLTETT